MRLGKRSTKDCGNASIKSIQLEAPFALNHLREQADSICSPVNLSPRADLKPAKHPSQLLLQGGLVHLPQTDQVLSPTNAFHSRSQPVTYE